MKRALACGMALSFLAVANGADWLAARGDGQRTGWQPDERHLTPKTVKGTRLLWKKQLAAETQSSPLLVGPIITHRGIKELVIVAGASGRVSAVDADLGTTFWTRDLPVALGRRTCPGAQPMAPTVLSSSVAMPRVIDSSNTEDEFSDGGRPVLVVTVDGMLHSLRASNGEDISSARKLTEPRPVLFAGFGDALYGGGAEGCDGWPQGINTTRGNGVVVPVDLPGAENIHGIAVEARGHILVNRGGTPRREFADSNIAAFEWRGREVAVMVTTQGLALQSHKSGHTAPPEETWFLTPRDRASADKWSALGGLTTWEDQASERWICATGTDGRSFWLQTFRVVESERKAAMYSVWRSADFAAAGAPVVASDVVYFIGRSRDDNSDQLKLIALEATTGRPLLSISEGLTSGLMVSGLGLANGHLCFTSSDGVLYCFGLPIEI